MSERKMLAHAALEQVFKALELLEAARGNLEAVSIGIGPSLDSLEESLIKARVTNARVAELCKRIP